MIRDEKAREGGHTPEPHFERWVESPLLELLDDTDWMQDPTSQINRFIQIDFVDGLFSSATRLRVVFSLRAQITSGSRLNPSNSASAYASELLTLKSLQTRFIRTSRVLPRGRGSATK